MNERIYQIDDLLNSHKVISFNELMTRLEVSRATLKRDLAFMKDRLNAPIVFNRELGGYQFDRSQKLVGQQYELPGLWFKAEEIHALLTMQHLLSHLDSGGLLGPHIKPLLARLTGILGTGNNAVEEVQRRIKFENVGFREFHLDHFQSIGSALLRRKRLFIRYHARGKDDLTEREVSPQRLVYYRNNWYLDAWCHLRNDIRNFSLDAIRNAEILETASADVSDAQLNEVLGTGYGIFTGRAIQWATLIFSKERARWVSAERWHAKQQSKVLEDGRYELRVPFNDSRELVLDILRHGAQVEVIAPASLRETIKNEVALLARLYQ
ncbi:helix-turn-helix transcriptional regulator [Pseudomethylobacillus aquaticus]|nr:YafY family protein [Pseudomethylobacillus aquaticus]